MNKYKCNPLELFLFFVKIGCFTFGGGWSILAQMEHEFVDKQHIITKEELLDITSVGRSMPGIMITNISIIFGYHTAGPLGAVMATLGIVVSPVVILSILTYIYNIIKDNIYVTYIMQGIRSAVVPIILVSVISLWKSAMKDKICLVFCLSAFLFSTFTNIGNINLILIGITAALILAKVKKHGNI